jgi:hypothetical protein
MNSSLDLLALYNPLLSMSAISPVLSGDIPLHDLPQKLINPKIALYSLVELLLA